MLKRAQSKLLYPVVLFSSLMLMTACDGAAEAGSKSGILANVGATTGQQTQSQGQGDASGLPADAGSTDTQQTQTPADPQPETLSQGEIDSLLFMREEEKLARDTYLFLYDVWGRDVFSNIADSEQQHTDAMLELLDKYGLEDPAAGNGFGVFTNETLQALYDDLVDRGSASLIDALIVGATIEEIDILDIQGDLDSVVDNPDIEVVYESLLQGSRNHLRAFVSNLDSLGYTYVPDYLTQAAYDEIINSVSETGGTQVGSTGGGSGGGKGGGKR
ncbi:MAG: DUF2202 domain-containing protein [Pseudomonadota bacterium]|nr:DUF2202 domain-containing protein [Pseudomonadota bacterium]